MTKELFIEAMKNVRSLQKIESKNDIEVLKILEFFVYNFFASNFGDEGVSQILWFIQEHHNLVTDFDDDLNMLEPGQLGMWDDRGNPILMDTIDDLWEFLTNDQL